MHVVYVVNVKSRIANRRQSAAPSIKRNWCAPALANPHTIQARGGERAGKAILHAQAAQEDQVRQGDRPPDGGRGAAILTGTGDRCVRGARLVLSG